MRFNLSKLIPTALALSTFLAGLVALANDSSSAPLPLAKDKIVKVGPNGTNYDPAVKVSQIPAGAWMCVMGSVHYASQDRGNGKCPRCGMDLKQAGSSKKSQGDNKGHQH